MEESAASQASNTENPAPTKEDSFISRFKISFSLPPFVHAFVIPAVVVIIVLLVGGGGTYLVVSNVLGTSTQSSATQKISEPDIPAVPSIAILPPTSTPTPTSTPEAGLEENIITTPQPNVVNSWYSYGFSAVHMNFYYPPGWTVNLGGTSGAPYLYIQNFTGSIPSTYSTGQYAVLVSRLEQIGISTVSGLATQLAINDAGSTYINGVNYGLATVLSSKSLSVKGNSAHERTVKYSSFPNTNYYELYILDGSSNVIKFMPLLDVNWGQPYFDLIVSTVNFTN